MPRVARMVIPGLPHHITQRSNYRQKIFFRSEDYRLYLNLLAEYARHYGVAILGYCLMPNHVHLILVPRDAEALGRLFRRLHGDYARAIHVRLRRRGHLTSKLVHPLKRRLPRPEVYRRFGRLSRSSQLAVRRVTLQSGEE